MSNKSNRWKLRTSTVCLAVILLGICLGGCFQKNGQTAEELKNAGEAMSKVTRLTQSEIGAMGPEDITQFYSEMRSLFENGVLTVEEMNIVADNFCGIWNYFPNLDEEEFNDQSYHIFSDIYEQTLEQDIPTEYLTSWASLPNVDVICKYLYSNGYGCPENAACPALYLMVLSDDDAERMTQIFFENSELDANTAIPKDFILLDYSDKITNQAWAHFNELSKNMAPDTTLSSDVLTANFCNNLLACASDSRSIDKIVDIEENILANPYYDISVKYVRFCNASYDSIVSTAVDTEGVIVK